MQGSGFKKHEWNFLWVYLQISTQSKAWAHKRGLMEISMVVVVPTATAAAASIVGSFSDYLRCQFSEHEQ